MKEGEVWRDEVGTESLWGGEPYLPPGTLLHPVQLSGSGFNFTVDSAGVGEEALTGRRGADASGRAHEQAHADFILECSQLPSNRGVIDT